MAKSLQEIMQEYPNLCSHGYRTHWPQDEIAQTNLAEWRDELAADEEQFIKAHAWCASYLVVSRRVNKRHTSYGLKHICERYTGYVTNGTFIAAMISAGFTPFASVGSPNPNFNVTDGAVKRVESALHP